MGTSDSQDRAKGKDKVRVKTTPPPPPRNSINGTLNMHCPTDSMCIINPVSSIITPILQMKKRGKERLSNFTQGYLRWLWKRQETWHTQATQIYSWSVVWWKADSLLALVRAENWPFLKLILQGERIPHWRRSLDLELDSWSPSGNSAVWFVSHVPSASSSF